MYIDILLICNWSICSEYIDHKNDIPTKNIPDIVLAQLLPSKYPYSHLLPMWFKKKAQDTSRLKIRTKICHLMQMLWLIFEHSYLQHFCKVQLPWHLYFREQNRTGKYHSVQTSCETTAYFTHGLWKQDLAILPCPDKFYFQSLLTLLLNNLTSVPACSK